MSFGLTTDEFDALQQIAHAPRGERPNACISRNAKRLSGLKYIAYAKDGRLGLTEKGEQTLFLKRCIDGLRAVTQDAQAPLDTEVAMFLQKKAHIVALPEQGGFQVTARGAESLADIDASQP